MKIIKRAAWTQQKCTCGTEMEIGIGDLRYGGKDEDGDTKACITCPVCHKTMVVWGCPSSHLSNSDDWDY